MFVTRETHTENNQPQLKIKLGRQSGIQGFYPKNHRAFKFLGTQPKNIHGIQTQNQTNPTHTQILFQVWKLPFGTQILGTRILGTQSSL